MAEQYLMMPSHAVSLIRGLLDRQGWTGDQRLHPTVTTIATLEFGSGRSGVYAFTAQQTRSPYVGQRWMDEEIAVATLLDRTARWVHGEGPEPYPLSDGIHDQQVALAIEQAADTDTTVTTTEESWSSSSP